MRPGPRQGAALAASIAAAFAAVLAAVPPLSAQELSSWTLGGSASARPFASWASAADPSALSLSFGSASALELSLRARVPSSGGPSARAEASAEAAVMTGAAARAAWAAAALGLAEPDSLILPFPSGGAAQAAGPFPASLVAARLRTLFVRLDFGAATATVGRQVLSYGRGAYWSPADLFAELDATGLSPAKKGVDALRLRAALGETWLLDLAASPRADPAEGSYALRASGMAGGLDLGAQAAFLGEAEAWAFGADFKADLVAGVYGEALCLVGEGEPVLRAAAGADWSAGDLILAAEYYFDGDPASGPAGVGSHNVYSSLAWAAGPFLRLAAQGSADLSGGRGAATALAAWDAAQGTTLTAYLRAALTGLEAEPLRADAGAALELKF